MIYFNIPPYIGKELDYVKKAIENKKICGDGEFTKKCDALMEKKFKANKVLLTTSGTDALELAALLCDLREGDEVILPSFTFSSTANAFVLRGARLVFVDIRKDTMNIDENLIESAITNRTKVICVVHYAGVSCEMDKIMEIAHRHNIIVVEDAAHGVMAKYRDKYLGTIGDIGCYSFHETKNYSMGEGGAILLNNIKYIEDAEIIREKGTDRSKFLRGQIDKYTWIKHGSSFLPSELNAAYLYGELEEADLINDDRLRSWNTYNSLLEPLERKKLIERPFVPLECTHNAHMYYIKVKDLETRTRLQSFLKEHGVATAFHYIPLHSSPAGSLYGIFHGQDINTTAESERLLRLPMYYGLTHKECEYVCKMIYCFYESEINK